MYVRMYIFYAAIIVKKVVKNDHVTDHMTAFLVISGLAENRPIKTNKF